MYLRDRLHFVTLDPFCGYQMFIVLSFIKWVLNIE